VRLAGLANQAWAELEWETEERLALGAAHGFEFAPLLGRILADLALHGGTDVDISPFAPDRPALTAAVPEARYLV